MTPQGPRRSVRATGANAESRPDSARVWVELNGVGIIAGQLYSHRSRGTESASFSYNQSYLADSRAYALDPTLPLLSGTQQTRVGQKIFGAFSDSCPDRWGQRLIERNEHRRAKEAGSAARSFGAFDLLLSVRDDLRQGAIRYAVGGEFVADEVVGIPVMTDLPTLLSAADNVANAEAEQDPQSLALLLRAGSSLGGARPKAHVRNNAGEVAIAKFPSPSDEWNVMAWEKVALDLAAAAGVWIPSNQLVVIAGRNVLIVDRFDREVNGLRRGYMSAMTALEASDGDVRSYVDIAEAIEERSVRVGEELAQLWRRVAFSILISNTDDHLRNHAFLHVREDSWRLSPAFDLNPNPYPGPKHLSTAINSDTSADLQELLSVAALFRLTNPAALEILREVGAAVAEWRSVAASHGLTKAPIAAMAPAFEHAQADIAESLA
jgi:serine/threonine-protein kinase HipA